MPSLEKISEDEVASRDVRGIRGLLKKLATMYNAQLNNQIVTNSGRNLRTISESNDTWELDISAAAVAKVADLSLYDATTSTGDGPPDVAVGTRFGNISPDGTTCTLASGVNPWPDDFGDDGSTKGVLGVTASGVVWVEVTVVDGDTTEITSISLDNGPTLPTASSSGGDSGSTTYTNYLLLGTYTLSAGKLTIQNPNGVGSQIVGVCHGIFFDPA